MKAAFRPANANQSWEGEIDVLGDRITASGRRLQRGRFWLKRSNRLLFVFT